jgi:hypothetical protein
MIWITDGSGRYEAVQRYVVKVSLFFGGQCSVGYFIVWPQEYSVLCTNFSVEDK